MQDRSIHPTPSMIRPTTCCPRFREQPSAAVCSGGKMHCLARVVTDETGGIRTFATSQSGFGPADLASAYKFDTSVDPGATIAIIGAYGYAKAASDLAAYRSNYGLPACTVASGCLKIVNQRARPRRSRPRLPSDDDWTVETALDLDMASAACPKCKLLFVEANDDQRRRPYIVRSVSRRQPRRHRHQQQLGRARRARATRRRVRDTTSTQSGVGIFVAAGDDGYNDGGQGPDYPGTSAHVTAVGGTNLAKSSSAARGWTEGAWDTSSGNGAGGSACSMSIPKPSWQTQHHRARTRRRRTWPRSATRTPASRSTTGQRRLDGRRWHQRGHAARRRHLRPDRPRHRGTVVRLLAHRRLLRRHERHERHLRQHPLQGGDRLGRPHRQRHAERRRSLKGGRPARLPAAASLRRRRLRRLAAAPAPAATPATPAASASRPRRLQSCPGTQVCSSTDDGEVCLTSTGKAPSGVSPLCAKTGTACASGKVAYHYTTAAVGNPTAVASAPARRRRAASRAPRYVGGGPPPDALVADRRVGAHHRADRARAEI